MRVCTAKGKKAMFHKWRNNAAVVEYEDGTVEVVRAQDLVFLDTSKVMANLLRKTKVKQEGAPRHDTVPE